MSIYPDDYDDEDYNDDDDDSKPCPVCGGDGYLEENCGDCDFCEGTGWI